MLLVDTNVWLAAADRRARHHDACSRLINEHRGALASTAALIGTPGASANQRMLPGAELEIIEVVDPTDDLGGLDARQRLFVTAHWSAAAQPIQATIQSDG